MDEKLNLLIENFDRAETQLAKALAQPEDEFIRDSCIQRFEFTFEIFWKLLRQFAIREGLEVQSPRAAIKMGFELKILTEDGRYLGMLKSRNLASHTYTEEIAEEIFRSLPSYREAMLEGVNEIKLRA